MSDSIIEPRRSGIDPEINGPIPPNSDGRQRDILQDQEDRQRGRQAVGESIVDAPPPPPPQEAFNVSPPPPMPSLFSPSQTMYDVAKEAAQDVFRDLFKNININGISPDVSGGNISFNIPTEPSASSSFALMNGLNPLSNSQNSAIQPSAVSQQPQPQDPQQEQIDNFQNQAPETQTNALNALSNENNIPAEVSTSDLVNTSIENSQNQKNTTQRSWNDYEGDNPIERNIGTSFYALSKEYGSQPEPLKVPPLPVPNGTEETSLRPATQSMDGGQDVPAGPTMSDILSSFPKINDFQANVEKAQDFSNINDPIAQYIYFTVCRDGAARRFLIPAFGPL